jgi:hypothetical protein
MRRDRKENVMPRVYHNGVALTGRPSGAAGRARPVAGHDPAARAVVMRPIDQRGTDPVDAGLHVTINTILSTEGL